MEDYPIDDERFNDVTESNLQWAAAAAYDEVACTYFWEKSEELKEE